MKSIFFSFSFFPFIYFIFLRFLSNQRRGKNASGLNHIRNSQFAYHLQICRSQAAPHDLTGLVARTTRLRSVIGAWAGAEITENLLNIILRLGRRRWIRRRVHVATVASQLNIRRRRRSQLPRSNPPPLGRISGGSLHRPHPHAAMTNLHHCNSYNCLTFAHVLLLFWTPRPLSLSLLFLVLERGPKTEIWMDGRRSIKGRLRYA